MAVGNPNEEALTIPSTETSIEDLRLETARLREGLMARNTVRGYGYDTRMFGAWCARRERQALPASVETLSLYLTDLLGQGKKVMTARRRKCAIAQQHRALGLVSPATSEIRELLTGAQRLRGEKPRQMRPIMVRELRRMSAKLAGIGTPVALRNRALLVVGFASALRRSNLGALMLADVEFCRQGVILNINREKQDQEGKGRLVGLVRGRKVNTCPVRVLRAWLRVRGAIPGPLFPRLDQLHQGQPMGGATICRAVTRALTLIGIDPEQYGAHSLRAGFVTAAGEANVGELLIARQTGHRNMQVLRRYFRRSDIWRSNASACLGL